MALQHRRNQRDREPPQSNLGCLLRLFLYHLERVISTGLLNDVV
jgi:hypothetical protein